jgi:hypothetical protein
MDRWELAAAARATITALPANAKASSRSAPAKSGMSRLSLSRRWYPPTAPASAPNPPRTAPSASGRFTVPCIVAPQIVPDTTRDASGTAFNRLGVKGSLSAINSLIASLAILFAAADDIIVARGESPGRIHPRFSAQAITAGAVIGRKPATAPMPIANAEAYWRFIFVSASESYSQHTYRRGLNDLKSSHHTSLLAKTFCGIYRLRQSLHSHLESRWLTNAY